MHRFLCRAAFHSIVHGAAAPRLRVAKYRAMMECETDSESHEREHTARPSLALKFLDRKRIAV